MTRFSLTLVLAVCAALVIAAGAVNHLAQQKLRASQAWVTQTKTVQLALASLLTQVHQARANARTYLLTARPESRESFQENRLALALASTQLQALVAADEPAQQRRAQALGVAVETALRVYEGEMAGTLQPGRTRGPWTEIKAAADDMSKAEDALLSDRLRTLEAVADESASAGFAAAALALLLLGAVAWLTRRLTEAHLLTRVERADALQRLTAAALSEKAVEFQLLADNMSQLAWIAAGDGGIYWYNERWYEFTGVAAGSTIGWGWTQVHHPDHLARVEEKFRHHISHGLEWEDTFPLRAADGSYRWFLSRAVPLRNAQGAVTRWFGTNTDITANRLAETARAAVELLEIENSKLRETTRLKSRFLADMSHELRTPLNAIIGFSGLLQEGAVPPDSPKFPLFLAHIGSSGRELLHLIDGLLDLARTEAGKIDFHPETLNADALLSEVLLSLHTTANAKSIRLVAEVDPQLDRIHLDPMRLKQVLFNFLSNAIKFSAEGGAVTVRFLVHDAEHLRLEVEDKGIGIAPADIARLFVDFQQLDSGMTKRFQGTGLGLALTRRLVEAQGGRVGVRSALGVGSVFFAVINRLHGTDAARESLAAAAVAAD